MILSELYLIKKQLDRHGACENSLCTICIPLIKANEIIAREIRIKELEAELNKELGPRLIGENHLD